MSRDASKYYTITLHVLPGTAESGKQSSVLFGMPFYEKDQRRAGNADRTQARTSHTIQGIWRLHPVGSCVSPVCCPFQPLARCPQSLDSLHPPQVHLHLSRVAFLVSPAASWPVSLVRVLNSGHHYHFQLHGSRGYPRPAQHFSDLVYVANGAIKESVRTFLPLFPRLSTCNFHTTCQGTVTPLLSSLSCQGK